MNYVMIMLKFLAGDLFEDGGQPEVVRPEFSSHPSGQDGSK